MRRTNRGSIGYFREPLSQTSLSFWATSGFARGPVQFDSSGNGAIRELAVHAGSPHPDPLPQGAQGEGTARIAQWKDEMSGLSGLFSAQRKVHPLPEGEGWGEGEQSSLHSRERRIAFCLSQTTPAPAQPGQARVAD